MVQNILIADDEDRPRNMTLYSRKSINGSFSGQTFVCKFRIPEQRISDSGHLDCNFASHLSCAYSMLFSECPGLWPVYCPHKNSITCGSLSFSPY